MSDDPSQEDLSKANILLTPAEYQAIGLAVTNIARLEELLGFLRMVSEVGVDTRPNELEHQAKIQDIMKEPFHKRAEFTVKKVLEKTGSKEEQKQVKDTLDAVIKWRNFLCHGTIKKLPDGRLYGKFWHRKSFDKNGSEIQLTFVAKDLCQIAISAAELFIRLEKEFELERARIAWLRA